MVGIAVTGFISSFSYKLNFSVTRVKKNESRRQASMALATLINLTYYYSTKYNLTFVSCQAFQALFLALTF